MIAPTALLALLRHTHTLLGRNARTFAFTVVPISRRRVADTVASKLRLLHWSLHPEPPVIASNPKRVLPVLGHHVSPQANPVVIRRPLGLVL